MHLAPLGILAALGVTGLVLTATSKAGASTGNAPGKKPEASSSAEKSGKDPSIKQENDDMPLSLKKDIAKVIQDLTVDPSSVVVSADGTVTAATITGPVTKEAVQAATALAAELDKQGFPIAAKTVRDLANLASKRIPDPPKDKQIPLPAQCFSEQEQLQLTRTAAVERDPNKLQAVIDALKKKQVPAECKAQVQAAIDMLVAIKHQAEAKAAEDAAIKKTEEILKAPDAQVPSLIPVIVPPVQPTPASTSTRVVVVNKGEGFANITKRLLGTDSKWRELRDANLPNDADGRKRAKDTDAKGGVKPILQPGQKLFVPASWPAMPSVTVSTPLPAPAPPSAQPVLTSSPSQPSTSAAGPAVVTVHKGEGPSQVAIRLLGQSQGAAKWKELRNRNIPVDAAGKTRAAASDGGFKPGLNPGDRLFVPESWPVAPGTVIGYAESETPSDMVAPKSDAEIAAESMCAHLLRCQGKRPDTLGRGREDKSKILRFKQKAGLPVSPNVTPECLLRAAELGVSQLPLVMSWGPEAKPGDVVLYRSRLLRLAREAHEAGNLEQARELADSAKRERGQGGINGEFSEETVAS